MDLCGNQTCMYHSLQPISYIVKKTFYYFLYFQINKLQFSPLPVQFKHYPHHNIKSAISIHKLKKISYFAKRDASDCADHENTKK